MNQESRGPVWPIVLALILLYVIAALIEPCDGACTLEEEANSGLFR